MLGNYPYPYGHFMPTSNPFDPFYNCQPPPPYFSHSFPPPPQLLPKPSPPCVPPPLPHTPFTHFLPPLPPTPPPSNPPPPPPDPEHDNVQRQCVENVRQNDIPWIEKPRQGLLPTPYENNVFCGTGNSGKESAIYSHDPRLRSKSKSGSEWLNSNKNNTFGFSKLISKPQIYIPHNNHEFRDQSGVSVLGTRDTGANNRSQTNLSQHKPWSVGNQSSQQTQRNNSDYYENVSPNEENLSSNQSPRNKRSHQNEQKSCNKKEIPNDRRSNDEAERRSMTYIRKNVPQLCRYADEACLNLNYLDFKDSFDTFLSAKDPSYLMPVLVRHAVTCSQSSNFAKKLAQLIISTVANSRGYPCLKMRGLWFVGEIFRIEYDFYIDKLRSELNVRKLFQEFFKFGSIRKQYKREMQAIFNYWKVYTPSNLVQQIESVCSAATLHYVTSSKDQYSSCEAFYRDTEAYKRSVPTMNHTPVSPESNITYTSVIDQTSRKLESNVNSNYASAKSSLTGKENPSPPVVPNKNMMSETMTRNRDQNERLKTFLKKFSADLDELLTMSHSKDVPNVASRLLFSCMSYGTDSQVSESILKLINDYVSKAISPSPNDRKFLPNNCVRILWVIGYIFCRGYANKVPKLKLLLEFQVARIFQKFVFNVSAAAYAEMRMILAYWKTVMAPDIILSVVQYISNPSSETHEWILCDVPRTISNMQEFYHGCHLSSITKQVEPVSVAGKQQQSGNPESSILFNSVADDVVVINSSDDNCSISSVVVCVGRSRKKSSTSTTNIERDQSKVSSKTKKRKHRDKSSDLMKQDKRIEVYTIESNTTNKERDQSKVSSKTKKRKHRDKSSDLMKLQDKRIDVYTIESESETEAPPPSNLTESTISPVHHVNYEQTRQKRSSKRKFQESGEDELFKEFHRLPATIPSEPQKKTGKRFVVNKDQLAVSKKGPKKSSSARKTSNHMEKTATSDSNESYRPGLSKLEMFRKRMERDEAIVSLGLNPANEKNVSFDKKVSYLRKDFTLDEMVSAICDESVKWDIVKTSNGVSRVKLVRNRELLK